MAFNVNHGLVIKEFDSRAPNGEPLNVPAKRKNLGFALPDDAVGDIKPKKTSSLKYATGENGSRLAYVVVNDEYIRMEKVETEAEAFAFPAEVDGMPVLALGPEVLADNESICEITCPPAVREIGACAFRSNSALRRVVLPAAVTEYHASWLQHCDNLEELVLPDGLGKLPRSVFDHPRLRRLVAGSAVREVEPGASEKTTLEEFALDSTNPYLDTDGTGLYSKGFTELLALVRPVSSYQVDARCQAVGRKAVKGHRALTAVGLPAGLVSIEPYAFAHTGLRSLELPATEEVLGERCFFHCEELRQVRLNRGLREVRDAVFAESGLEALHIPATVQKIGVSVVENSRVRPSGADCSFSIDGSSPYFWYDGEGGIYRKADDGLHLVQLIDRIRRSYAIASGTVRLDPYALAFNDVIEETLVPEGVTEIGDSAFRICRHLRTVELPESLQVIGKEAFLDTVLESIRIPRNVTSIGVDALVTAGAHHSSEARTLSQIEVDAGNPCFYMESGILCQRGEHGDRALMFNDAVADVTIPEGVATIASYAFNNACNVRTLVIGPNLKTIASCGFTLWSLLDTLDITLAQPEEGRTRFTLRYPQVDRTRHEIALSLGGSSWVNVPEVYRHYDNCVANAHDYANGEGIDPYEQATFILNRLADPIFMTPVSRTVLERTIRINLAVICKDIARHDDRELFGRMADAGFLDAENIEEAILAVQPLQDASMTGYLLELKRRRFGMSAYDFDL